MVETVYQDQKCWYSPETITFNYTQRDDNYTQRDEAVNGLVLKDLYLPALVLLLPVSTPDDRWKVF